MITNLQAKHFSPGAGLTIDLDLAWELVAGISLWLKALIMDWWIASLVNLVKFDDFWVWANRGRSISIENHTATVRPSGTREAPCTWTS